MSLILDALNRSQAERGSDDDVPGIETQHWVDPLPSADHWRVGLPWVALGLAFVVIAWLVFSRNDEPEQVRAIVSSPVSVQTQVETKTEANQATQVEAAVSAVSAPQKKSSVAPPSFASSQPDNPVVGEREGRHEPSRQSSSIVADLYNTAGRDETSPAVAPATDKISPPKQQENEQTIDIEKMVNLARRESENAELSEHSARFLSQLSQQTKDQVPTIYYTQHDYSSTASQSSVTLNGKLVRVGGSVAGNIKLLEILPKSIVLSDRGTEFRLRALNSWINL